MSVDQQAVAAVGQRIRSERSRRGWAERQLAARAGLPLSRLHRIETDPSRAITVDEILGIAHALGVPTSWLVNGPQVRNRVLAAARCRNVPDAEAAVDAVVHVLELVDQLDALQPSDHPKAEVARFPRSRQSPRLWGARVAEATREAWDATSGPILELSEAVESDPGLLVIRDALPATVDGLTITDPVTGYTLIAVSTRNTWERQRFTLAHELGHALAGDNKVEAVSGRSSPTEVAASEFARNLLVPIRDLMEMHAEGDGVWEERQVAAVAWSYRVSPSVVAIQLSRAGLAPDSLVRRANSMSADTWGLIGGWDPERRAISTTAQTRRVPPGLAERTLDAWQRSLIPLATLSRLLGEDEVTLTENVRELHLDQVTD